MSYTDDFLKAEGSENVSRETYEKFGYPDMTKSEWIGTMRIKYGHLMGEPLAWDFAKVQKKGGGKIVLMKCKCGRIGDLSDHQVDDRGNVEPSVVCMNDDCDFHEYVILEGWGE